MLTTGQCMRLYRKRRNMTAEQVANEINVTGRALLYWERDERTPDIFNFHHLSKLYGVTIEQLMGVEQPMLEMKEKRMIG